MDTTQDLIQQIKKESADLARTNHFLTFLGASADRLLALESGMIDGRVISTDSRESAHKGVRRHLLDAFERLMDLDAEVALNWVTGLAPQRAAAVGDIETLTNRALEKIDYFVEIPEADSTVAPRLAALRSLGAEISRVESPYPLHSPSFGEGRSSRTIDRFQRENGVRLPFHYRDFVNRCGRVEGLDIFPAYCLIDLLHIESLLLETDVAAYCRAENLFPLGTDGGGSLYLGELAEPCRIYRWDQVSPIDRDEPMATSFNELLDNMAEDWRRFMDLP